MALMTRGLGTLPLHSSEIREPPPPLEEGGRDSGSGWEGCAHDAAEGLKAEGQGGDVQEHDVLDGPAEHAARDGGDGRGGKGLGVRGEKEDFNK